MKILVLGGTRFLGRHVVDAALARGHVVTVFNRGRASERLPPEVRAIFGDREGDLGALAGRSWDAAVDTSGYSPAAVRAAVDVLADAVEQYVYVSSLSVYADVSAPGVDESAPVVALERPGEPLTSASYGAYKALCEREVDTKMPARALFVRAGLLVGPRDDVGRFTYWTRRVARGGDVLAPGRPGRRVQLVDARDVADWIVHMAEVRAAGTYNVTGPDYRLTMGALLAECAKVTGSDARLAWAPDEFLLARGVAPWTEMPLWIPETGPLAGFFDVDASRAIATGLAFRPLERTVADTIEWAESRDCASTPPRDYGPPLEPLGIDPLRERRLLDELRAEA